MYQTQLTKQTITIHNNTNLKIRELGERYYQIKSIFDKLNIHRDDLYNIGKALENEYKGIKKGLHLQSQMKRSKEALISWYAENFSQEIYDPNSKILERLNNIQYCKFLRKAQNFKKATNKNKLSTAQDKNDIQNIQISPNDLNDVPTKLQKFPILNQLKFNQEIDKFEAGDNKTENIQLRQSHFQYDDIFVF